MTGGVLPILGILLLFGGVRRGTAFLAAVGIHELGHLLGAWITGTRLRRLGSGMAGLHLDFRTENLPYRIELLVLLAGSLMGLTSAGLCRLLGIWPDYCICALGLNLVNLLPIGGLDGGGILVCLLHRWTDGDRADRICRGISVWCAILFWLAGAWIVLRAEPNPTWLLFGMAAVAKSLRDWDMA